MRRYFKKNINQTDLFDLVAQLRSQKIMPLQPPEKPRFYPAVVQCNHGDVVVGIEIGNQSMFRSVLIATEPAYPLRRPTIIRCKPTLDISIRTI